MFNKLIIDTTITAAAFFVASVVGLFLTPVLIGAYGVSGFGLVVLARTLLPGGGVGILDFGIAEIATQIVATARATNTWAQAKGRLKLLAALTLILGASVAIALYALSMQVTHWFNVPESFRMPFESVVWMTALTLPLLFSSLVFEGIIKGYERFSILRTTEVVTTLISAAVIIVGVWINLDFTWPIYTFLAFQLGKCFLFGAVALRMLPAGACNAIDRDARQYVFERGRLLLASRILGTVQHQSPTLLIGFLAGPAGVGVYDTILRLPRFAKVALSVIGSTLMPTAMRLDAAGDRESVQVISQAMITLLPALIFPPIATLAIFSGDVLQLWLGGNFVPYAPWLALFLVVPAFNTVVSFQNSVLMNRPLYLRANNRIAIAQTTVQIGISLLLVRWLSQNAFILGQVAATLIFFVWQLRLGHSYLDPSPQLKKRFMAFVLVLLTGVGGLVILLPNPVFSHAVTSTLAGIGALVLIWFATIRYFLTGDSRKLLLAIKQKLQKTLTCAR